MINAQPRYMRSNLKESDLTLDFKVGQKIYTGRLMNFSLGGICLMLPIANLNENLALICEARPPIQTKLVWKKPKNPDRLEVGLEFIEKNKNNVIHLADYVYKNIQKKKSHSLLYQYSRAVEHEISTPLTLVMGMCDELRNTVQHNLRVSEVINTIEDNAFRVKNIISSLSKTYADEIQEVENIEIQKVIQDSLDQVPMTQIQLINKATSQFQVIGVPHQLTQVLVNLLKNAAEAIQKQNKKWICLELGKNQNFSELRITDSGSMDPLKVKKIFNPFYSTKKSDKNMGMGLSICKKIMSDHSGYLNIDPNSKNTCFVLGIPSAP
jgi:signal transduction histidine kinase